jgi:hypothetical protein
MIFMSFDSSSRPAIELDYFTQKPASAAYEYEYRFASVDPHGVANRDLSSEECDAVIGKGLSYASLLHHQFAAGAA